MTIIQIIILITAAGIGGAGAWFLRNKTHSEFLNILLSFSGAYLLGVVVLHLLPEVFAQTVQTTTAHAHNYSIAIFILLGFFIQLIIVQFTRGIEHGHMHLHEHLSKGYVFGVLFGLGVHAFMEGLPLADRSNDMHAVYWAIVLHKIPETFALATVLFFSYKNSVTASVLILFFALLTPLGSFAGKYLSEDAAINMHILIAIVCGSLIHISTTIIFEASGKAHKISLYKFLAIVVGAAISLLTLE
ncbi:MAG: ZIP family metal transporter [Fimbriimonadaceae bacterium]|nr:ZIP family metal transporter [Chitinophagales bacterium]